MRDALCGIKSLSSAETRRRTVIRSRAVKRGDSETAPSLWIPRDGRTRSILSLDSVRRCTEATRHGHEQILGPFSRRRLSRNASPRDGRAPPPPSSEAPLAQTPREASSQDAARG
ncbi:unnamed protein product [Ixodes pacificus]